MISKQNGEIKQHQNQVLKLETPPVEAGDRLPIEKIIGQTETTKAHESPLERKTSLKTCPDSDIKTLSAAPREDDLARDVRQSNIGTANSNLPNRGTNKKEKLFTGDKSMSKDILSNELKTKGLPKSLLPPEPNSLTQATSNEQNKRTGHTSKSTKLEQDVPNQTKKQTQEDQSRTLDQEISSNLAQIVRNTERLEDYIRTTRGNDNTRANDSQRKPTDTAYTRANTRPDENESDIIQSELDETHRLVERNRRNLLHYKQQFGINSNYGPGNSSQRDSEGQNDTLTPVQSTSQIGKGTTSHTPSSKKPKRRISAIVISDDEEDGQINSPPIKRILVSGNDGTPTKTKSGKSTDGNSYIKKSIRPCQVSGGIGASKAAALGMDISNRKRSSLDNTRHENQSDEKVVNTHSEDTKLSATDLSFTSAHQFASECCTPTKQIKLSVKSERLRKSSNVSPKSDASDANSPLEHSPSSASTAHASSLPGSVSPIRIKYSPLRKDFVIFRNGRNQPLRSSHPMTTSSLSVPPSHTRKDYVNIRNRRNQPPSSSHPVSSSPLSGSSSGRNDFVSLQNRRNQPFNQSRPMTTSLPVSSSAGASSFYLPRSVQRIGLSGYSSPLGPPPRTLFSSRPYGHSPRPRTFLSSRPNEKESPKIISSDSISSSKVPSIQSFFRLPNATAPGSSVPVPSQKPTTRKPTVKQESSINNQMANAQSLSSSAMEKSSSPIKQENITGNQTPKSTETLFGVTIPAAYQYVDTRNRSSQLSTKSCGPTTPVSIKQRRNTYDQSSSRHSPTRSTSVSVKSERNSKAPTSQSLTCSSAPMIGRNSPVLFRTKLRIRNLDVCPDLSSIPRTRDDRPYWQPPNVSLRSSVPSSTSSITLLTSSSALDRQSTNNSAIRTATTSPPTVSLSPFTFASSSAFLKQEKDTKTSGSSASSFSRVSSSADRTSPVFFRSPLRNKFSSGSDPFGSEAQTRTPRREDQSNQQSHLIQRSSVPAFASSATFPTRSSASNDQSANTTRIMTNTTLTSSYSSPILHATSPRLQPKQGKAAATKTSNSLTGSSSPRATSSGRTSPVLRLPKLNIVSSLLLDPDGAVPSRNPPKRKHPVCQHSDQSSNKTSIGRRPVSSAAVPLPPPTGQASPLPIKQEKSEFDQRISTGPSSSSASALGQDFGGRKADKSFSYFSRNSDPFRSAGPSAFRSSPKRRLVVPVTRIDDKTCVSTSTTNVSGSASTSTSNAPSQAPSCFSTNNSLPASTASDFSPNTSTERPVYHHLSNNRRSYPYLPKTGYSYWSGTRRTPTTQSQPTLSSLPNTTSFSPSSRYHYSISRPSVSTAPTPSSSSSNSTSSSAQSSGHSLFAPLTVTLKRIKSEGSKSAQPKQTSGSSIDPKPSTSNLTDRDARPMTKSSQFTTIDVKPRPSASRMNERDTRPVQKTQNTATNDVKPKPGASKLTNKGNKSDAEDGDCTVCFERPVNAALIPCGHLCMCYECAVRVKKRDRLCPLCRQPIKSVLRVYKS